MLVDMSQKGSEPRPTCCSWMVFHWLWSLQPFLEGLVVVSEGLCARERRWLWGAGRALGAAPGPRDDWARAHRREMTRNVGSVSLLPLSAPQPPPPL